ncbi:VRR-NUC domain-containing protein [Burkholderia sp. Bp8990]|uniref:VRR-NUC domain-containing protein n=1 Tax=Burkholderia sp. Bp8990 TaxID=2184552 RepID=UPI000F5AF2A5|nr:VRR-NUC domain-containing protein [Burkholderia sp. Bp8990]RQS39752.1 VRR-NUC domain-containing protein [Burkholderia sp. Bp8990]
MQRLEEVEQAKLIKWSHKRQVRELMPALRWLHHSPNGLKRSAFTGAQAKALGVKTGFPDLVLPERSRAYVGLVIEMKYGKGKASDDQEEWLEHFANQDWRVHTCYSAEEARAVLCEYFGVDASEAPALDA